MTSKCLQAVGNAKIQRAINQGMNWYFNKGTKEVFWEFRKAIGGHRCLVGIDIGQIFLSEDSEKSFDPVKMCKLKPAYQMC